MFRWIVLWLHLSFLMNSKASSEFNLRWGWKFSSLAKTKGHESFRRVHHLPLWIEPRRFPQTSVSISSPTNSPHSISSKVVVRAACPSISLARFTEIDETSSSPLGANPPPRYRWHTLLIKTDSPVLYPVPQLPSLWPLGQELSKVRFPLSVKYSSAHLRGCNKCLRKASTPQPRRAFHIEFLSIEIGDA